MGLLTEETDLKALGEFLGMKVVSWGDMAIPKEVADIVNETIFGTAGDDTALTTSTIEAPA